MARPCATCQHIKRPEIDRRLAGGEPAKKLAREYGINPSSLQRHRVNCAGLPAADAVLKEAAKGSVALATMPTAEEFRGAYAALRARIEAIVDQAEGSGSLAVAITGLREVRATLNSQARIAGHDRPAAATVNVGVNVDIGALVDRLVAAIGQPSHHTIMQLEALVDGESAGPLDGAGVQSEGRGHAA